MPSTFGIFLATRVVRRRNCWNLVDCSHLPIKGEVIDILQNACFEWPPVQGDTWGRLSDGNALTSCSPDDVSQVFFGLILFGGLNASSADMGSLMKQYLKAYTATKNLSKHQVEHLFDAGNRISSRLSCTVVWSTQTSRSLYEGCPENFIAVNAVFPDTDHVIFVVDSRAHS